MSKRPKLSRRAPIPGHQQQAPKKSGFPIWGIVVVVLFAVALAAAIAVGSSTSDDPETAKTVDGQSINDLLQEAYGGKPTSEFRQVEIEGKSLPELPDTGVDPAVGMDAPLLKGANFVNKPVVAGEGPTMLLFGAHWCHVCQTEVPNIAGYVTNNELLPEGVSTTLISTGVQEDGQSQPPTLWVASTKWDGPVLVDSDQAAAAQAYGLSGFPFMVFIDEDGKVTKRVSGAYPEDQIQKFLAGITPGK